MSPGIRQLEIEDSENVGVFVNSEVRHTRVILHPGPIPNIVVRV